MNMFRSRRFRIAPIFLAAGLILALPGPSARALDATATTDPLVAATMPKIIARSSTVVPAFLRPEGRLFDFEMPREIELPDRYPAPGFRSRTPQIPVRVSLLTPQSNAIFSKNSMVNLSWLPGEREISEGDPVTKPQFPIRYEIIIWRHDIWSARIYVKERPTTRYYTYIFSPPGPGRYHWYVKAVYSRAMHGIDSDIRTFMVLP